MPVPSWLERLRSLSFRRRPIDGQRPAPSQLKTRLEVERLEDRKVLSITLVSASSAGVQGSGASFNPEFSANGRYVVFMSTASNLVSGDTNGFNDIFRKDLQTGEIVRVSTAANGTQANSESNYASISADGRYVAFLSSASNLVSGDTNDAYDIFRKDLQTGAIIRVSTAANGTQANNLSGLTSISADGRYVAFESYASNLVAGDTNSTYDIFRKDLQTGAIVRVSTAANGTQANNSSSLPSISADGRYVAFESHASNLVAGDTNNDLDIFRKDLQTGAIIRVNVAPNGAQTTDGSSVGASISADGRYVAFESYASNLVAGDVNGNADIFRRDLQTGVTICVSTAANGAQTNGSSFDSSISADGRYVAFQSTSSDLVSGDTNGVYDIFRKDLQTGAIVRVSTAANGTQANNQSRAAAISADGQYLAFYSLASNLVSGDSNNGHDVFVWSAAPTDIVLSNNTVGENTPIGTLVGNLSANDPDTGDTFTFALVSGPGSTGNAQFSIVGNQLRTSTVFDYEAQTSYSIRVQVTDSTGLSFQKVFTINVTNVAELIGFEVQNGATQRSFVNHFELNFASAADAILAASRIQTGQLQLGRYELDGTSGVNVDLTGAVSISGSRLIFDFGAQGIGGNRNTSAGDGYYLLRLDSDGNQTFDTTKSFYRLFGDANGDQTVSAADASFVLAAYGQTGPGLEADVNGDGIVNSLDRTLAIRQIGRSLASDLWLDD